MGRILLVCFIALVVPRVAAAGPWLEAPEGSTLAEELDAVLPALSRGEAPQGRHDVWVHALGSKRDDDATWTTRVEYQVVQWRTGRKADVDALLKAGEHGGDSEDKPVKGAWRLAGTSIEGDLLGLLPRGEYVRLVASWDEDLLAYPEVRTDGDRVWALDPVVVQRRGQFLDAGAFLQKLWGQRDHQLAYDAWNRELGRLGGSKVPVPVELLGARARARARLHDVMVTRTDQRVGALRKLRAQILGGAEPALDRMALANALARIEACREAVAWADDAHGVNPHLSESDALEGCRQTASPRRPAVADLIASDPEAGVIRRALYRSIEVTDLPRDPSRGPNSPDAYRYMCDEDGSDAGHTVVELRLDNAGEVMGALVIRGPMLDDLAIQYTFRHAFAVPEYPIPEAPHHVIRLRIRS